MVVEITRWSNGPGTFSYKYMKWTSLVCVSLDTWWSFIGIFCVEEKGRTREMELWTGGLDLIIDCKNWMRTVYQRRWELNPSWVINKPVNCTHSLAEWHFLFTFDEVCVVCFLKWLAFHLLLDKTGNDTHSMHLGIYWLIKWNNWGRRLVYIRILYNIQNLRKQIYLQQN